MRNPETMATSLIGTWMKDSFGDLYLIKTKPQLNPSGYYTCDVVVYNTYNFTFRGYFGNTILSALDNITSREDMIAVMFCECLNS